MPVYRQSPGGVCSECFSMGASSLSTVDCGEIRLGPSSIIDLAYLARRCGHALTEG